MSGPSQPPSLFARTTTLSSGEQSFDIAGSGSPAQSDRAGGSGGAGGGGSGSRPKRTLIESACSACRRRKSRCDGMRPACSRCLTLRTECSWEAEEGESRWSALRRRNQLLETERAELRELIHYLQVSPAPAAETIYRRLRSLESHEDVLAVLYQIRDGELLTAPSVPPLHRHSTAPSGSGVHHYQPQRLPPIRTTFDMSDIPTRAGPGPGRPPLSWGTSDPSSRSQDSLQSQGFPSTTAP